VRRDQERVSSLVVVVLCVLLLFVLSRTTTTTRKGETIAFFVVTMTVTTRRPAHSFVRFVRAQFVAPRSDETAMRTGGRTEGNRRDEDETDDRPIGVSIGTIQVWERGRDTPRHRRERTGHDRGEGEEEEAEAVRCGAVWWYRQGTDDVRC